MKHLAIVLCDSPFQHESVDEAFDIATEALAQKHAVHLFLMMDGVYAAYTKQSGEPFSIVAPHSRLEELAKNGARIGCCRVCMELRGISEDELSPGVEVSGLFDLSESLEDADAVLSFARRG